MLSFNLLASLFGDIIHQIVLGDERVVLSHPGDCRFEQCGLAKIVDRQPQWRIASIVETVLVGRLDSLTSTGTVFEEGTGVISDCLVELALHTATKARVVTQPHADGHPLTLFKPPLPLRTDSEYFPV